ncbi:MAG: hypothetical protein IJN32_02450 [Thermoguttaceae bacterium]|nr:hypothetical protein [Thermoguttaceae bacterium]
MTSFSALGERNRENGKSERRKAANVLKFKGDGEVFATLVAPMIGSTEKIGFIGNENAAAENVWFAV